MEPVQTQTEVFQLTSDNWQEKASAFYDYSLCSDDTEFAEDLQRITYIKRLFRRYLKGGDLNERSILNHLIILNNVFHTPFLVEMLFFRLDPDFHPATKTFLLYLGLLKPEQYPLVSVDRKIADILRSI